MPSAIGESPRALRIATLLAVILVSVELVLRPPRTVVGLVFLLACLLPWHRVLDLPAPLRGSARRSWRLLGIGIAAAMLGTVSLQAIDAPAAVVVMVPLVLALPAVLVGGWHTLVRTGACPMVRLDLLLVVLALVLVSWTWVLDGIDHVGPAESVATMTTFTVIALVAGLSAGKALRDPGQAAEFGAFGLAMVAFAAALLVPPGGALQAYGSAQVHTVIGNALGFFAIVHGQLNTTHTHATTRAVTLGGTRVAVVLVLVAFIANGVITDVAGIPPNPVEGVLQIVVLAVAASRVYVTSRAWQRARAELDRLAHSDALTGLRNRLWLTPHLDGLLADGGGVGTVVAMIDIDRFRIVNDSLGHHVGDEVIQEAGRRLRSACSPHEVVRFGGDEFLVVLPPSTADPVGVTERARAALSLPIEVGERRLRLSASVGLATAEVGTDHTSLVGDADAALYHAKELGRDRVVTFDAPLREASLRRLVIENGLRSALDDGSLSLVYQPVVNGRTDALVGVEALLRWHSPTLGPVSPAEFIVVAEEIGAIVPIGQWVVDRVCTDLRALDACAAPRAVPRVSVNVSGVQLLSAEFPEAVAASVAAHGLAPDRLILEVTESALLDTGGVAATTLLALSRAGFRLAVDDFGTGYSALSYLETLPVDILKIDRSFVSPIGVDGSNQDRSMIPTLVRIADLLGLTLTAEGVETTAQRDALLGMGCDLHQGYLYARPMPTEALGGLTGAQVVA